MNEIFTKEKILNYINYLYNKDWIFMFIY
jgi:hypothetical protein